MLLLFDVSDLKNPAAHGSQSGWTVVEPGFLVYLPGGHLFAEVQESIVVLRFDFWALKNPVAHTSHLGWAEADPAVLVYLPAGHLV